MVALAKNGRNTVQTLAALRDREQRRIRDPVPERLLKKYLRLRPKPPRSSTSMTKKPRR
jgi:hypothetical protein